MKLRKESVLARTVTAVVAIASGAMMLGLTAMPVQAQTSAELNAQIESLLAQIAALQAQLNADSGTSPAGLYCNFTFTRDLAVGATGQDVMALQQFLNSVPGVQVAATGVGSAGMETSYFGTLTAQAVSAFQVKYSSEILAPLGLTSGTGYWGQSSRAKAVQLCAAAPSPSGEICGDDVDNDGDGFVDEGCDGDDDDDADSGDLEGGEGDITDLETISSFNNEEVAQGQTETVYGFSFEADGADISVRRVDVTFDAQTDGGGSDSAEPWDFIEEITLYHDGDEVASMDADSSSDWSETTDDVYRVRFSGISEIVREDEASEWTVEVTARAVLDSGDLPQTYEVDVDANGLRAVDAAGINIYNDATFGVVDMTFSTVTAGDLDLTTSTDFDDDVVAHVTDTDGSETENVVLGMFELDAENQDITVQDLGVDVVLVAGADVDQLVNTLKLYVGDELIQSENVSSSAASTTVTFDDIDYVIEEDDTVEFTVKADLNDLNATANDAEGEVVYVAVFGANIDAEDAEGDTVTVTQDWNASASYTVSVYSTLPVLSLTSISESLGSEDSSGDVTDGTYTFKFEVEAIGGDIYVPDSALGTTTSGGEGTSNDALEVLITGGTASTSANSISTSITSSADDVGDTFQVEEGATETFTVVVNYDNASNTADFYHAIAQAFNWGIADDAVAEFSYTAGFSDWKSDPLHLDI